MAEKSKKAKGGGDGKPAAKKAADAEKADHDGATTAEKAEPKAALARAEEHDDGHGHAAGAHAHGAHGHKPNIREYLVIFVVLAVLTVVEVGVAQVPGINRKLMGLALVGLAVTKAAIVGLYYMHLKQETKIMKWTVALPVAAPAFYALVLISEAAWRLARW
jgi:caa(3)-type oxidase subunit IV